MGCERTYLQKYALIMSNTTDLVVKESAEEQQLAVRNQDDDDDINEISILVPEEIYQPKTWSHKMLSQLQKGSFDFIQCLNDDDQFRSAMSFMNNNRNLHTNQYELYPEPCEKIVVETPKNMSLTYNMGYLVNGGYESYFVWDFMKISPRSGGFGPFFSATWCNINSHNKMFAKVMTTYRREDVHDLKLQTSIIVKDFEISHDKLYTIDCCHNQELFSTHRFVKTLKVEKMSQVEYNKLFTPKSKITDETGPVSEDVMLIAGFLIMGVKEHKNEIILESVTNKKHKVKHNSLAIKPMVLFKIVDAQEVATNAEVAK